MSSTNEALAIATGRMHEAIAEVARLSAAVDPELLDRFDYRVDLHRRDGGVYPLIYRAD